MSKPEPSPREMAHAFTPQLTAFVDNPLFSDVWADPALSPRDRSIATVAALVALYRPEQLPAHLRRACDNGVTRDELAALITHVAFYAGFPAGNLRVGDRCTDADGGGDKGLRRQGAGFPACSVGG
jgi:4-carboxymuconolactone decarboxylase